MKIKFQKINKSKLFLIVSILSQGFSFIISLLIWAKFSLTDFSLLLYIEIITLTISSFFGFSSDQYLLRNFLDYDEKGKKIMIFNTWLINWISIFLILLFFFIILNQINIKDEKIILYSISSAALTYLGQIPFSLIRFESNLIDYIKYNLFTVVFKIIFVYFFVSFDNNGLYSFYEAMFYSSILVLPWFYLYLSKRSLKLFDLKIQHKIIKFSTPIIPSTLLSNFTPIIFRIILQDFGTKDLIAQFGIISKLTSPITALQNALRVMFVPQIVHEDKKDLISKNINLLSFKYFIILLFFSFVFALFSDLLFSFVFRKSLIIIDNIQIFIIAAFFGNIYSYLSIGIFLSRKNHFFWIPIFCQILIIFIPGIYLINNFGLNGLLLTEILKYLFYIGAGSFLSYKFYKHPSNISMYLYPILLVFVILIFFIFLDIFLQNIIYLTFLKVTFLLILIKIFKKKLRPFFNK